MVLGKLYSNIQKSEVGLYYTIKKIIPKWIKDEHKSWNQKLREENIGSKFFDIGRGNLDFWIWHQERKQQKQKSVSGAASGEEAPAQQGIHQHGEKAAW